MKAKQSLLSLALLLATATGAYAQGYTLTGTINGVADGDTILLTELSHQDEKPFAEAIVRGGRFTFTGNQADPRAVFLSVKGKFGTDLFVLDNHNITVTGQMTGTNPYVNFALTYAGSTLTDSLKQMMSVRGQLDRDFSAYHARYADITSQMDAARQKKDTVEQARIAATAEYKAFEDAENAFFRHVQSSYDSLYRAHAGTWWEPMLMIATMSYLTPDQRPQYDAFTPEVKASYYGKMVHDEIFPVADAGEMVPDFTLAYKGKPVTLKELLAGNKYLLIDFWASWCVPCRREIPNFKKAYADYRDKGFSIVSISIDKNEAAWKKADAAEQLPWTSVRDTEGVANAYKVTSIPATFLVDSNGRFIASGLRGEMLFQKLAELLK